jgi:Tfp pilus assembly protein PilE
MLRKYAEIFSDPFFWLMAAILLTIVYIVYRKYVSHYEDIGEEEAVLINQLHYYGLKYTDSSVQNKPDVFEKITDELPNTICVYRLVKVVTKENTTKEVWAKIAYQNSVLSAVNWQPNLESL